MIRSENGEGFESTIHGRRLVGARKLPIWPGIWEPGLFVIEQEAYQGKQPMECMRENLAIMQQWGY
jgi:hypothetical protein